MKRPISNIKAQAENAWALFFTERRFAMNYLYLIIGILALSNIVTIIAIIRTDGVLKVDITDPHKDKYLLEFTTDLNKVPKRKRINLRVDNKYIKPQ